MPPDHDPTQPPTTGTHDSFLDGPTRTAATSPLPPIAGRVDRYRLLERLGEGGMGIVYLAEQEHPVRRQVALKVIRVGMGSAEVVARFEAERQALALMDHPGIARVLDAGATGDGLPYFVMELVKGVPINAYCDEHRLGIRERLELLIKVCEAVQHAHQKGVIHRDLKPSNILVSRISGHAEPKIIDFGIAKAVSQRLTDRTLHTELGRFIGTPEYMSPEQAEHTAAGVDTRADIYSLGVVLYELLTGRLPFSSAVVRNLGSAEIQRLIKEVDPARPSTRVTEAGDDAGRIELGRGAEAVTLARHFRGDLDWITMKALEKSPSRRYGSASEFAADIRRHLCNEPVLAGPPSAGYRLGKFMRRHRVGVAVGVAVSVALIVGIAGTMWQAGRAIRAERDALAQREEAVAARDDARREAETAQAISGFLSDMLASAQPEQTAGREVTVRELLDRSAEDIAGAFADKPAVESALRATIGRTYFSLGRPSEAERHLRAAIAAAERAGGSDSRRALNQATSLGRVLTEFGRMDEARGLLEKSYERLSADLGDDHPESLHARLELAHVYWVSHRVREALALLEDQGPVYDRVFGPGSNEALVCRSKEANCLIQLGRPAEAEAIAAAALPVAERELGEHHSTTLAFIDVLAEAKVALAKYAEAEPLRRLSVERKRRVLGPDHPETVRSLVSLAWFLYYARQLEEAEATAREALAGARRAMGEKGQLLPETLNTLAAMLANRQKHDEAAPLYREAIERFESMLGPDHPRTIDPVYNLGLLLVFNVRTPESSAEGEALLRRALDARVRVLGESHSSTLLSIDSLGAMLKSRGGRNEEALAYFKRSVELRRTTMGLAHPQSQYAMANVEMVLIDLGRSSEAVGVARERMEILSEARGPEHAETMAAAVVMGRAMMFSGRPEEAAPVLRAAYRTLLDTEPPESWRTISAAESLMRALMMLGLYDEVGDLIAARRGLVGARGTPAELELSTIEGRWLLETGRAAEAEPVLRRVLEARELMSPPSEYIVARVRGYLGAALAHQGRFEEAEPLLRKAAADLAYREPTDSFRRRAEDDLIALYEAWGRPEEAAAWRARAGSGVAD